MKYKLLAILIFLPVILFSQGSLLIIGGGSESDEEDAWSTEPYSWAVEQSFNKKVAIVSYSTASGWMRTYFVEHCGAVAAKDFKINSQNIANSQATYDSLMNYDVIFLKGGDQWNYYATYKGTLTQQAIIDKWEQGGVICGTSAGLAVLSEVIFTAERGSVYPDECIEDPNNQYLTLENDFFDFFPGYIFDSHFTDRGRGGRMLGFLAHWKMNRDELIDGVGIDETTAMTISRDNIGMVYGTGAANLYKPLSPEPYHLDEEMLIVDSLEISQLLHGCTIDFNTGEITGLSEEFSPEVDEENGNYLILASGGDALNDNQEMLNNLANLCGNPSDDLLIITGSNQAVAETFKNSLNNLGAQNVQIYSGVASMGEDPDFERAINEAEKFLFVNNEYYILEHFIDEGNNGALLADRVSHDGKVIAFVGDNSRFAGKTVIENYLLDNAAGTGSLIFKEGLGLLKTTVIIPNSYKNSDMYMNPAAGIPFAMLQYKARFGIWLTSKNYMKYAPADQNTFVTSFGDAPAMIIELQNTKGGFATKTYSAQYNTPKMIAGFESMKIRLINSPVKFQTGSHVSAYSIDNDQKGEIELFRVWPNPAAEFLNITCQKQAFSVSIYSITGQKVFNESKSLSDHQISLTGLIPGVYFLEAEFDTKENILQKIIVQH